MTLSFRFGMPAQMPWSHSIRRTWRMRWRTSWRTTWSWPRSLDSWTVCLVRLWLKHEASPTQNTHKHTVVWFLFHLPAARLGQLKPPLLFHPVPRFCLFVLSLSVPVTVFKDKLLEPSLFFMQFQSKPHCQCSSTLRGHVKWSSDLFSRHVLPGCATSQDAKSLTGYSAALPLTASQLLWGSQIKLSSAMCSTVKVAYL